MALPLRDDRKTTVPMAAGVPSPRRHLETWAASQAGIQKEEKELMAHYFAHHDFLMQESENPADLRNPAASIFVNNGTSPNVVVREALKWIGGHGEEGPFHLTWYSIGALVPATLHDFRRDNPDLTAAAHVHMFPGTIDLQLQAQIGTEAVEYANRLTRQFSFMILGGHSFDLSTGEVRFHFDQEIPIQRTCAMLRATEKFLFFDSRKFSGQGAVGYDIKKLLLTSKAVTLYTTSSEGTASSPSSASVRTAFLALADRLLARKRPSVNTAEQKSLTLTIVGRGETPTESVQRTGYVR